MRTSTSIIAKGAVIAAINAGCTAERTFDIPEQRIPGRAAACEGDGKEPPRLRTRFAFDQSAVDGIEDAIWVHLIGFDLWITDTGRARGDADDFSFIRRLDVFIEKSDGSEREFIARLGENVECGATTLSLDVDPSIDLVPYFAGESVVGAVIRALAPCDEVTFEGAATFEAKIM
jgi:hypothetical protein